MPSAASYQEKLPSKTWAVRAELEHQISLQRLIVVFLLWSYGLLLASMMAVVFLLGFHVGGFALPEKFLQWLGGATVGTVGGLLTLTLTLVFRKSQ